MALKKIPYKKLQSLIGIYLTTKENPETEELIKELAGVVRRGYLRKSELKRICKWKAPRAIRKIDENSPATIKNRTTKAFKTKSEKLKLELLTSLSGVSVPMASAILMLTNPKRYGVIDIRVWQLLYEVKTVNNKPSGVGFNFKHWYRFLIITRYFAKMYRVNVRDIERTLFNVHKKYQKGKLYSH